ncbi:unnamed protein product, partial [Adineta steineri]
MPVVVIFSVAADVAVIVVCGNVDVASGGIVVDGDDGVAVKTQATPLDEYVNTPDPVFSWRRIQTYPQSLYTFYVLNMTSQQWFDDSFSTQPIWWHYVTITVPKVIRRSKTAFLMIDGGSNNNSPPTGDITTELAVISGSITASVRQIPNQNIRFLSDPTNSFRNEDSLIAWTWKKFMDTNGSDPRVLLRFPMTKAVVRAMDTVQQFLEQERLVVPQEFVIGGASKRGWTAWTAAAVDNKRVVAAIPIVMDLLNLRPNMMSHYRSLGGWTFAFNDYYAMNITRYMNNPNFDKLAQMVDPYSYFDRYTKTKIFQLQGAGDEFFLPDCEDFFWNDLQKATGGSYLRRVPNTGHNIAGYEDSLISFYLSIADKEILPSMKWTRTVNGTHGVIRAVIDFGAGQPKPTAVTAYQARTGDTLKRDFRQAKLSQSGNVVGTGVVWANAAVQIEAQTGTTTTVAIAVSIPSNGYWIATFIQATFPGRDATTLSLTTESLILPNTYPVSECNDEECYAKLVRIEHTSESITLQWARPQIDGGNPVRGYLIEKKEKETDRWIPVNREPVAGTEYIVPGLVDGKEYEFRVAAVNRAGPREYAKTEGPIQARPPDIAPHAVGFSAFSPKEIIVRAGEDLKTTVPFVDSPLRGALVSVNF